MKISLCAVFLTVSAELFIQGSNHIDSDILKRQLWYAT